MVVTKPKIDIDRKILAELETKTSEIGQVILHFILDNPSNHDSGIRIWPTTFLYDLNSDHSSELVHVENITMYPTWKWISGFSTSHFTLIFSGLPKSCHRFMFKEICDNQQGAWCIDSIVRNETDVYYLKIS